MLASKFIETELAAYIESQRLPISPDVVKLISKAFEAYEEYKQLVSGTSLEYNKKYPLENFIKE